MDYAIEKLNNNGWVHVFPEARVNMDKTFVRFIIMYFCTICMKELYNLCLRHIKIQALNSVEVF